ncbi:MAG TPA: DUF559 domain-containing protein [Polyangiaceae bacterium]
MRRRAPTQAALWRLIQGGRIGVWFRHQVVIGGFIADFLAPGPWLIVEVDGEYHARRRSADARRDRLLSRLGYRVLRLPAELVLKNPEQAVARIREALVG